MVGAKKETCKLRAMVALDRLHSPCCTRTIHQKN